jgi:excisionase family DNA binding protein
MQRTEELKGMERNMMTIKDVAEFMQLTPQTIQRYVLKKEIPFHKVGKIIRFRFSEIEKWINDGGGKCPDLLANSRDRDLFTGTEDGANSGETAVRTDGETGEAQA